MSEYVYLLKTAVDRGDIISASKYAKRIYILAHVFPTTPIINTHTKWSATLDYYKQFVRDYKTMWHGDKTTLRKKIS